MKLAIGSDHAGYQLKSHLIRFLQQKGIMTEDCGADTDERSCAYVPIAREVGLKVTRNEADLGILVCGTGVGMSIAANKVPGIRASVCNDLFTAKYAKSDVDLNVLCLGGRVIGDRLAEAIVDVWIETDFAGGRFVPRIRQIADLEEEMGDKLC